MGEKDRRPVWSYGIVSGSLNLFSSICMENFIRKMYCQIRYFTKFWNYHYYVETFHKYVFLPEQQLTATILVLTINSGINVWNTEQPRGIHLPT